jgi:hypothetical protein
MAEEVTDVNEQEITTDIFSDEAETPAPKESSPEETKTEAPAAEEGAADEAPADEPKPEEAPADDEAKPEGEVETEAKPRTAETRKDQLNNEIRELVAQKNRLREEVAKANSAVYAAQTPEEILAEAQANDQELTSAEARIEAFEQRQRITEYNNQVSDLNANLSVESLQVMSDFPMFNPEAPEYDAALATRAAAVYQKAAKIETDPQTGLIVAANVLPYDIYKAFAETHQASIQNGQVNGQRAAEKMLAATDTPPAAAPKSAKVDPLMDLWTKD